MEHFNNRTYNTKKFVDALGEATSYNRTENDALTHEKSGSPLVDFFGQAGAMRKNPEKALELFQKAYASDKQKAIRILFYLRDVRGGQGERELFRTCLEWLGSYDKNIFENVVEHIPEYGRWDDLFFENEIALQYIKKQIEEDSEREKPSLLAKWLPTVNASSPRTRAKARAMANALGLPERLYRREVRDIRKKIATVEEKMSAQKWDKIQYPLVPSQASRIYRNAFMRHDGERYEKYLEKVSKGKEKINASTLYPYQIYNSAVDSLNHSEEDKTVEELWKALPDYTDGRNAMVIADVSGSMQGDPMSVSVSLALYFAERNKGAFKNYFMTFSERPELQKVEGESLRDKMLSIENAHWGMNTNIQAAFDKILDVAIKNQISQEDIPKTLYIISDMEFDMAVDGFEDQTFYQTAKSDYESAGYELPNVVFWNVDARHGNNLPVRSDVEGATLVSGFSPSIFKMVVEGKTSEQLMLDVIESPRYARIKIQNN